MEWVIEILVILVFLMLKGTRPRWVTRGQSWCSDCSGPPT